MVGMGMLKLDVYSRADHQKMLNLLHQMERQSVSIPEAIKQIEQKITASSPGATMLPNTQQTEEIKSCPTPGCNGVLITLPVNVSPATMVGGNFRQVKLCKTCHCEEWL